MKNNNVPATSKPKLSWYAKRTEEQRKRHNEYCKKWKQAKRDANCIFVIEDMEVA